MQSYEGGIRVVENWLNCWSEGPGVADPGPNYYVEAAQKRGALGDKIRPLKSCRYFNNENQC